ncbi:IS1/IS1595 family N-terminal zinc-binding domain-containing protein [Chroococcidiopsis cubana]|uniref:IS1/IS1595 family N-terminal zinc-binding domain-containing protein n=1 Tax=Chroococcidiopsis cubana TaxID=171392 RepID=UPI003BAF94E2
MKCLHCNSNQTVKSRHRKGRQCYKCQQCGRQFLESYRPWKYPDDVKQLCIKMYLNGMGLRGIERGLCCENWSGRW